MNRPLFTLLSALPYILAFFPISTSAQDVPVMVNTIAGANVMVVMDDSGSMNAIMTPSDFDRDDPNLDSYDFPSVLFKLKSGSAAPSNSHVLEPCIMEMNYGLWGRYDSSGSVYDGLSLSNASSIPLVEHATCNRSSGSTTSCPGSSSSPTRGINVFKKYGDSSVIGSSAFSLSHLAQEGGSNAEDSEGNEWLYVDYRKNDYHNNYNWSHTWPSFDSNGNITSYYTRPYFTNGKTCYFNGKEIFLSLGWYDGRFLKWLFYDATDAQIAAIPGANRMDIVKEVMIDLINDNPDVEFGFSTLNGTAVSAGTYTHSLGSQMWTPSGDGWTGSHPRIRAPIGTSQTSLVSTVQGIYAKGGTPLTTTYIENLRYFAGESDRDPYCYRCRYSSPIDSNCDGNFVVLLTDGLPSGDSRNKVMNHWIRDEDRDGDESVSSNRYCSGTTQCSAFLDDAAYYAFNTDFNSRIDGDQVVRTYAVGLGIGYDLLDDLAVNGGSGQALRADTAEEITEALESVIATIVKTPVSGAGVAVAEVFGENSKVFRPRFEAGHWTGNIDVFESVNGSLSELFDIGAILEARDVNAFPRTIIAGHDPDGDGDTNQTIAFSTDNASTLRPLLFERFDSGAENPKLLAPVFYSDYPNNSAAENLINFIHGKVIEDTRLRDKDTDVDGTDGVGVEKLADVIFSRPKYVGKRSGTFSQFQGYSAFQQSIANEPDILLVGANGGALHAFDPNTGEELWAYIPSSLLKYLELLARPTYNVNYHRYFVDGQISVSDVYLNGSWKTIAMFGLGYGGSSWTVLDITDRDSPQLLFEVSDPTHHGESWGDPSVAIFGGASNSNNPADFEWHMLVGTGEDKSSSGVNLLTYDLSSSSPPIPNVISIAGSAAAGTRSTGVSCSQNDADLNTDRCYIGVENGDLYRVEVNGSTPSAWDVDKVYNGSSSYPITASPTLVLANNPVYTGASSGVQSEPLAVGIFFGTGRYDTQSDVTTLGAISQKIIGIFDPANTSNDTYSNAHSNLTTTNLQNQSISSFDVRLDEDEGIYYTPTSKYGFYMNMETEITLTDNYINPVGMVTHKATNARGTVLFSTFLPTSDVCSVGGYGFLQAVNFRTGGGSMVDYYSAPDEPFYNGGVADLDEDGQYDQDDLNQGYSDDLYQAVLDTHVESIDLESVRPYVHDDSLELDDIRLHSSNGGVMPAVSSIGSRGVPGPPAILFQEGEVIIQSAYTEDTGEDPVEDDELITICFSESGTEEDQKTIRVDKDSLETYLAQGAFLGECSEEEEDQLEEEDALTICFNNVTMVVTTEAWNSYYLGAGASQGACEGFGDGQESETDKPTEVEFNIYSRPVKVITYHQSTSD